MSKIDNHNGNPQDEYNMIQNNYPYAKLVEEANYVLEEDAEQANVFVVTKKPEGEVVESVSDVWGFIKDKNGVLIKRANGNFDRFNFKDKFETTDGE